MHRMKPAELARRTGIDAGTITKWRTLGRLPSGPDLVAVAKVLGIDAELLLGCNAIQIQTPGETPRVGRPPKRTIVEAKAVEAAMGDDSEVPKLRMRKKS